MPVKPALLLSVLFSVLISCTLSAQSVRAGMNLANFIDKNDTATFHPFYDQVVGWHFGAEVDFALSPVFSIESGMHMTSRGFKLRVSDGNDKLTLRTNIYYISIPVSAKLYIPLSENFKFFASLGPYGSVAVFGKAKAQLTQGSKSGETESNITFGEDGPLDRYDYGLQLGGGMQFSQKAEVGAYYDLGLANIASDEDHGTLVQNRVLRFSLKVFFDK